MRKILVDFIKQFGIFFLLILISLIAFHFVRICRVSGESMVPNFKDGQFVLCVRSDASLGDVVVAKTDNCLVIKRIIGVSGDEIRFADGVLYRNGKQIEETHIKKDDYTGKTVIVPKGMVFLCGDNRPDSIDSRSFGCIKEENILWKVKE